MQGNTLPYTINPNERNLYKKMILQNACINEDLPYKERPYLLRNECQLHTTIKPQNLHKSRYA